MQKLYKAAVFIGRFQPVHKAHLKIIKTALSIAEKVIIVIGSSNEPRTPKNPWSFEERDRMIHNALDNSLSRQRVICVPSVNTKTNNQAWAVRVQESVAQHTNPTDNIVLIGHKKAGDASTFYLDMFPQWDFYDHPISTPALDASDIRAVYFNPSKSAEFLSGVLDTETIRDLDAFKNTEDYAYIVDEIRAETEARKPYLSLPYPPIFSTADAVVIQSGHVLMIKRRAAPGKGLWALPGGFVNANTDRSVEDAALRELEEETKIKVPEKVLRGNIKGSYVFDSIDRSARGRTITHAFNIVLPDGPLPKVKGSDDAEKAFWVPIAALQRNVCFEDHYEIISHFVGG